MKRVLKEVGKLFVGLVAFFGCMGGFFGGLYLLGRLSCFVASLFGVLHPEGVDGGGFWGYVGCGMGLLVFLGLISLLAFPVLMFAALVGEMIFPEKPKDSEKEQGGKR
jgi:hypothetical protein